MRTNNKPKHRIKSDEKVLDIIEYLKEANRATVTEIAMDLDIAKSTVHSHLQTLEHRGYVNKTNSQYGLGLLFVGIGHTIRENLWFSETVEIAVQRLAEETGERTQFMIEEHGRGYFIFRKKGPAAVRVGPDIGEPRNLHDSACGKAILAELPEEQVDSIIDHWGLLAQTPQTITDISQLKAELETIQERGWSWNKEESRTGLLGIGTPVTHNGELIGSLSVSGPVQRLKEQQNELLNQLRGMANEISLNLER